MKESMRHLGRGMGKHTNFSCCFSEVFLLFYEILIKITSFWHLWNLKMLPLSSRKDTSKYQQSGYFLPSWVCGLSRSRRTQHIQSFQSFILWKSSRFPTRNVQNKCGSHSTQVKHSDELCLDITEEGSEKEALESCFPTLIQKSDQKSVRGNSSANPSQKCWCAVPPFSLSRIRERLSCKGAKAM